ncbi:TPA: hypothetical protein HGS18_26710, partial [Escherichia coli]|nr:hypothetical protein [Escherichia coli]
PTSPNVATAYFWGHMADTATVSGKMLHRPLLKSELPSGVTAAATPNVNNETWALAHVIDSTKWDVARQCGSMNKPYSARTVISRIPSCLAVKCRTPEGI